jgi:peptidoglycan/LPS O-acetylase OafA/YrhL
MSAAQHSNYRPDIDGLRAVAVLSVVGFHASPRIFAGGFIGVDIFFVISGFLISSILFDAQQKLRFSYLEFYARRIRRIFPALIVVLSALLVSGWFLLLPDEYKEVGKQTVAGAGFVSNVVLWSEAGYFDTAAALKPLLHLWSLGVEEQFYLLWPLLVALLFPRARVLPLALGCIIVVSFIWNVLSVHSNPSAAFYLPIARFWELMLGAALAYVAVTRNDPLAVVSSSWRRATSEALSWCGLLLLGAALLLVRDSDAFPGWWALLPTLGALLLMAAPDAWPNRKLLSHPVMVFIGLISYPLYLWHWVLLTMTRIAVGGWEPSTSARAAAVVASIILAWLTYALIEKPIRARKRGALHPVGLILIMAFVAAIGLAVDLSNGAAFRYPPSIRPLAAFNYDADRKFYETQYRFEKCFLRGGQTFVDLDAQCVDKPDGKSRLLVLWGDSHAASLYPALKAKRDHEGGFRIAQFTYGACPPVVGMQIDSQPDCKAFNDSALKAIGELQPEIVLLESDWCLYNGTLGRPPLNVPLLVKTVNALLALGVKRVVVFGDLPKWTIYQPRVAIKIWLQSHYVADRTYAFFDQSSARTNDVVRAAIAGTQAVFFSPINFFCNDQGCLLSADQQQMLPVAWDDAHLSLPASTMLVDYAAPTIFGTPAQMAPRTTRQFHCENEANSRMASAAGPFPCSVAGVSNPPPSSTS